MKLFECAVCEAVATTGQTKGWAKYGVTGSNAPPTRYLCPEHAGQAEFLARQMLPRSLPRC